MQSLALGLMLVVMTLLAPSRVCAEPPSAAPVAAERVLRESLEVAGSDDLSAHARCALLHAARPGGDSLYCLGAVALAQREYPEALRLLRRALADLDRPLAGAARSDARARLARAESAVAQVRIHADPMPTVAMVDGAPVALREDVLVLAPGTHRITLRAPARLPVEKRVTVAGGDRHSLRVALPPLPADGRAERGVDAAPARPPLYRNPWLWSGIGAFVAAAAVGLALGLQRDAVSKRPIADMPFDTAKGP